MKHGSENREKEQLERLTSEIDKGLASLKAGRVYSGDEAYAELIARRSAYKKPIVPTEAD